MRSLRERLMAVAGAPPKAERPQPPPREEPFFCREHIEPLGDLRGIERTTLDEIRACDPAFTGSSWDVRRLLFLDTETTGLSGGAGTLAFEIGLGFIDGRGMVIRQYVMRDYGEEGAMLSDIASLLPRFDTLVTFNGKSFDIPLLESRMVMQRIRVHLTDWPHFDLLHACRRVYRLRLGRCNLAALEAAVLGEAREDDLPGAQVPQRYFDYLKTREFALLEDVLRHNRQDVKSLASLTGKLCEAFREPERLAHAEDVFGVGRTLLRGGHTEQGRRCMRILGMSSMSSQARMVLSSSYKKSREWAQSVQLWTDMIARGEGGTWPYVELAKYYEHTERDYDRALRYAGAALSRALNLSLLSGDDDAELAALRRRVERLKRKQAAQHAAMRQGGNTP